MRPSVRIKKILLFVASIAILLGGSFGCAPRHATPSDASPPPVSYFTHQVRFSGETLSLIASWYTNSGSNWSIILEHNPGLNPRKMRIGDVIRIPQHMVVKSTPLPKSFLESAWRGKRDTKEKESEVIEADVAAEQVVPAEEPEQEARTVQEEVTAAAENETQPARELTGSVVGESAPPAGQEVTRALPPPTVVHAAPQEAIPPDPGSTRRDIQTKTRDELLKELLSE